MFKIQTVTAFLVGPGNRDSPTAGTLVEQQATDATFSQKENPAVEREQCYNLKQMYATCLFRRFHTTVNLSTRQINCHICTLSKSNIVLTTHRLAYL